MPNSISMRTALLACLLLIVLVLLQHHKSFTADEVYELRNLSTDWSLIAARPDGFPPLYSWLLSRFVQFSSPANARLFSAIASVVGLLFVAAAGNRFGNAVGTRAALFYAVSACQLEYAQQARAYALYVCLGAMVVWAAVSAVYSRRAREWIMLVLSSVSILWAHYYAAPFLVAIWLGTFFLGWNGIDRSQRYRSSFSRRFLLAAAASVVLLIPWYFPLQIDWQNPPPVEAINPVDWTGLAYTYLTLIHGWCIGPSQIELFEWSRIQGLQAIAPWAVLSTLLFSTVAYHACFGRSGEVYDQPTSVDANLHPRAMSRWMAVTIIAVPLGSSLLALATHSSFVPRYMAVLVIPASLLLGLGCQLDRLSWRTFASWGLVLVNLISFGGRNFLERYDRENYRELVAFLKALDQSPKLVVLSYYLGNAIDYHADGSIKLIVVGLNSDEPDDWPQVRERIIREFASSNRFWIAVDWMRADDLRLAKRNEILQQLGAQHVKRISGTLDLFLVTSQP